jgi:hypothetical protein
MKKPDFLRWMMLVAFILILTSLANAQFITIARKIKSMNTASTDIASVIIDAGATNVYKAVIDTLTTDPKFKVTHREDVKNFVEFSKEACIVSIKVDSLAMNLSQITVAAESCQKQQRKQTDMAIDAIFIVCNKVGIKCTIE